MLQLSTLKFKYVNKLENSIDAEIQIKNDTKIAYATSKVLLDCKYQKDPCVVKVMQERVDKVDLFIETLINIFMSAVTKDNVNKYISSPDVITMGTFQNFKMYDDSSSDEGSYSLTKNSNSSYDFKKNKKRNEEQLILVQEKISGVTFKKLYQNETLLIVALKRLCEGLKILQKNYNFAHRDFHGENVMYSISKEKVYIIDFGYSCFSVPDTPGSIQSLEGGYGINQLEKDYIVHQKCVNTSSDICTLILSLIKFGAKYQWLLNIGQDICSRYTDYKTFTNGWYNIDRKVSIDWDWNKHISLLVHLRDVRGRRRVWTRRITKGTSKNKKYKILTNPNPKLRYFDILYTRCFVPWCLANLTTIVEIYL